MSRLRTRIVVKSGSTSFKLANLLFGFPEPNIYIDFPYITAKGNDVYIAKRDKIKKTTTFLPYFKNNTFFFTPNAPKMSYHFSGTSHIKLKTNLEKQIPSLEVNTGIPLDDKSFITTKIFEVILLNITERFPQFSTKKDKGTKNDKNLILDFENVEIKNLRLIGRISAFPSNQNWFNESLPNHPIEGNVIIPGESNQKSIFFNFSPSEDSRKKRVVLNLLFEPNIDFFTDTNICICATTGYTKITNFGESERLFLSGPIDKTKINLI